MLEARCVDGKRRKKKLSDVADKVPTSWRVVVWKASTVQLFLSSSLNFCDYHGTLATIRGVGSDLDVSSSVLEAILQSDQGEAVITHGPTFRGLGKRQLLFQLHPNVAPVTTLADYRTVTRLTRDESERHSRSGALWQALSMGGD